MNEVSPRRRTAGRVAVVVWAVALVWFCITQGFPFDRGNQTLWILSGLVAATIGRPIRSVKRIFLDWIPFILVLYLYDYSRHLAVLLGRPILETSQINWDTTLFLGTTPTVWLQQHFYDPFAVHWYDSVASVIYVSHFIAVWAIAAVLYMRNRREWFLWARALVVLSFAGLITFAIMPSAPPWYAARDGYLPPVDRIATRGLDGLGIHWARQLIDGGAAVSNDVAAIPSLHTGFAILIAVWFYPRIPQRHRAWGRPLLVAYPVLMLLVLVYGGEHYVVDGIIGAVYVFAVVYGLRLWDRRRARPSLDDEATALEVAAAGGRGTGELETAGAVGATETAQPPHEAHPRIADPLDS
ncbi:MAG TPA: phosphatase PAP2 family protein [Candidatus Angelobacter sp.]|nr:phosphatase PAP2 family protein [Candidatus Angelobacter sp.]